MMRYRSAFALSLLLGLLLSVYVLRISAPTDIDGFAQDRNVGYVMDALWNGHWLAQYDIQGRITSKPPLHTWIVAGFAKVGGLNRITLTLPSLLSIGLLVVLVYHAGRRYMGETAGFWAAFAIIMAPIIAKHVSLVRTDALFTLATALAALAAWRAWVHGKSWTPFWLAGAAATLIKGPLGLVLAAAGLLAVFWERRTSQEATPRLSGNHRNGLILYFLIVFGWFLLALGSYGQELSDKMIFDELFGQATGSHKDSVPGSKLLYPKMYFISRFSPFSLLALWGIIQAFRSPATCAQERRFERFLVCWILAGIAIFSLAAHHRADLLLPLWPAGALLAGRCIAHLADRFGTRPVAWCAAAVCLLSLGITYWTYFQMPERRARTVHYSESAKAAALAVRQAAIDPGQILHLDTPASFQMYLGTHRTWITPEQVMDAITTADYPILVAVVQPENFPLLFGQGSETVWREVFRWPAQDDIPFLQIFSPEPAFPDTGL